MLKMIKYTISIIFIAVLMMGCQSLKKIGHSTGSDEAYKNQIDENLWVFVMAGQSNMAGRAAIEPQDTVTNPRILTIDKNNNWIVAKEPLNYNEHQGFIGLDCGVSFGNELLKSVNEDITVTIIHCAVGGSSIKQWINNDTHRNIELYKNFEEKVAVAKICRNHSKVGDFLESLYFSWAKQTQIYQGNNSPRRTT